MDETTYKILMGASAFMVAMLGGMLAATTIQQEEGLEKLRKARNIIVPSYFVLALLSALCCFTDMTPASSRPAHFWLLPIKRCFSRCP